MGRPETISARHLSRQDPESYVSFYASVMANLVEVIGCDPGFDFAGNDIQYFARESADFPHCILALLVKNCNFVPTEKPVLWIAVFVPWWLRDVIWDWPSRGKGIDRS